jgi:ATP-dependent Clp protease adaptor protein ClpS
MSELIEKQTSKQAVKPPSMFKVIFLNDDFTTFEFVTAILMKVFQKSSDEADKIAGEVHQKGEGVVGQYTLDIAETKKEMAIAYAQAFEHPLQIKVASA